MQPAFPKGAWLCFSILCLHCRSTSLDGEGERTAKAAASPLPEKKQKLDKDRVVRTADDTTSNRHAVLPGLAAYSSDSSEPED